MGKLNYLSDFLEAIKTDVRPRQELNLHETYVPRDFKSLVSAHSITRK
jgi:hypothetical protein